MTRRMMAGGRLAMLGAMMAAASAAGIDPPAKVLTESELDALADAADRKGRDKTETDRLRLVAAEEKRRRREEKKRK